MASPSLALLHLFAVGFFLHKETVEEASWRAHRLQPELSLFLEITLYKTESAPKGIIKIEFFINYQK